MSSVAEKKRAAPAGKATQPSKRARQDEAHTERAATSIGGTLGASAIRALATELQADAAHVQQCLGLLAAGHTVPFIARYRAHETGGMEPPLLRRIEAAARDAASLAARCDSIIATLRKAERLSADLEAELRAAPTLAALETAYAPHKAKPCSHAERARALGCEPAALAVWSGVVDDAGLRRLLRSAAAAAGGGAGEAGLREGAQRILAELVARSSAVREAAMQRFERSAQVRSSAAGGGGGGGSGSKVAAAGAAAGAKKGKVAAGKPAGAAPGGGGGSENFRDYFDFSRPLTHVSSHAWLAMHRGAEQKVRRLSRSS